MIMVLSSFSWVVESTHRNQIPFPPLSKGFGTPLSGTCSSHPMMRQGCPASTETQTPRCVEMQWGTLSLPRALHCEEATVTRDAHSLQARHRPEWLRLLWEELLSVSTAVSLQIHNRASILQAYRASLCLLHQICFQTSEMSPTGRAEGSPPAFKSRGWNWGSPAPLRQVTEMELQPGNIGPHQEVGFPHSGSFSSKHPHHWFKMESLSWREFWLGESQTPPRQQFHHSFHFLKSMGKINFLSLKVIPVLSNNPVLSNSHLLLLCNANPSFPQTKIFHFILQSAFHLSFLLFPCFSTLLRQCKTFNFHLRGRFEEYSCSVRQSTDYIDMVMRF